MTIKLNSEENSIQEVVDLLIYLQNLKIKYDITVYTEN